MKHITVFIVEDEFLHLEHTKMVVEACGFELIGESGNADNAEMKIREVRPDLILMDIALVGKLNGISLAEKLQDIPSKIIFTTSFKDEETIIEATSVHPLGYLIKPIDEDNLKAMVTIGLVKSKEATIDLSEDYFMLKSGNKLHKVAFDDIIYAETAGDHYAKIVTANLELLTRNTLKQLLYHLQDHFVQTHRGFIVNLKHVDSIHEKDQVISLGNFEVPLGRSYRQSFLNRFSRL